MKQIGYISACIAGDYRYTSIVKVLQDEDGAVTVQRLENGAIGGMDGPGGSYGCGVREAVKLEKPTPANVVRVVRALFDETIRRYGKPSKEFTWYTPKGRVKGISAAKAKLALS